MVQSEIAAFSPFQPAPRLAPGTLYPTPREIADANVRRYFHNRALLRLVLRISDVTLDDKGNARSATIEHLEAAGGGRVGWLTLPIGRRLCLNGFRFELKSTPRAGLHIRVGYADDDAPRDTQGYLIEPPRYLATIKIARAGVLVLTPGDSLSGGYLLERGALPEETEERHTLFSFLVTRFDVRPRQVAEFVAGQGPRLDIEPLGYAPIRA